MRTRSICKSCHRMRAIGLYCATCLKRIRAAEQPKTILTPAPEPPPAPPIKTDIPTTKEIQPQGPAPAHVLGPPPQIELPPNVRVLTLPTPPAPTQTPTVTAQAPVAPKAPAAAVLPPAAPKPAAPAADPQHITPFILPNIEDDERAAG